MGKQEPPATQEEKPRVDVMRPMLGLRDEIDRLFDDFLEMSPFRRGLPALGGRFEWASPLRSDAFKADVVEREHAYEIDIDVPGLDAKDIEIATAEGCLTVRGEMKSEKEEKNGDYHLVERRQGAFQRSFRLPESVDADKIEATMAKGVLVITLPKKPEAQHKTKKIAVKGAD